MVGGLILFLYSGFHYDSYQSNFQRKIYFDYPACYPILPFNIFFIETWIFVIKKQVKRDIFFCEKFKRKMGKFYLYLLFNKNGN